MQAPFKQQSASDGRWGRADAAPCAKQQNLRAYEAKHVNPQRKTHRNTIFVWEISESHNISKDMLIWSNTIDTFLPNYTSYIYI